VNVEDINVGDEVRPDGCADWYLVTHIEGYLVVGRYDDGMPTVVSAMSIVEVRRPVRALGYEPVWGGDRCCTYPVDEILDDTGVTHVVTHWSDGTCTLDTIAAFREAHQ